MSKGPEAFRTISEVAETLDLPQHVLRFWETRFSQIKPLKRGGGRRYYRPDDIDLLRGIRQLLYGEGFTIKGVQRILKENGPRYVVDAGKGDVDRRSAFVQRNAILAPNDIDEDDHSAFVDEADFAESEYAPADDDDSEMEVVPSAPPATNTGVAHLRVIEGSASISDRSSLNGKQVKVLKTALTELVECKRLLDEAH